MSTHLTHLTHRGGNKDPNGSPLGGSIETLVSLVLDRQTQSTQLTHPENGVTSTEKKVSFDTNLETIEENSEDLSEFTDENSSISEKSETEKSEIKNEMPEDTEFLCPDEIKSGKKRARSWFFTWNNYTEEKLEKFTQWCKMYKCKFVMQREKGEKTGTPHIQGCVYFDNARTRNSLREKWPWYWEPCKNWEAAKKYCSKLETAIGQPIANCEIGGIHLIDKMKGKTLYIWQKKILDIIKEEPDERTIHWIVDEKGNGGKTTLAKSIWLNAKEKGENAKATFYIESANHSNAKNVLANKLCDNKGNQTKDLRLVMFDYPRESKGKVCYKSLEAIKNGFFVNTKFNCVEIATDNPHVIVFANWHPDYSKLSADRWKVYDISNDCIPVETVGNPQTKSIENEIEKLQKELEQLRKKKEKEKLMEPLTKEEEEEIIKLFS